MEPAKFVVEERRRYERIDTPAIKIVVEGTTYETNNWSLGGLMIEGYRGKLTPGALFTIDKIGAPDGKMASVNVRCRVVRSDTTGNSLMVSFLDVDQRAYTLLGDFMAERMRLLRGHESI